SKGLRLRHGHVRSFGYGGERVPKKLLTDARWISRAVVDCAHIDERSGAIEHVHVRRPLSAKCLGKLGRRIGEVNYGRRESGPPETLGACFGRLLRICRGIVRVDQNKTKAATSELLGKSTEPPLVALHPGALVTPEYDDGALLARQRTKRRLPSRHIRKRGIGHRERRSQRQFLRPGRQHDESHQQRRPEECAVAE